MSEGYPVQTMVIDTSAILAILQDEPERSEFIEAIEREASTWISAASHVEASIVVYARFGEPGCRLLDTFLATSGTETVPVDASQARLARRAYIRFGKGQHPAGLNFGDCFAYALCHSRSCSLLFKGDDFSKTDLARAI